MKTAQDPRHQRRITRMQHLFSYSFEPTDPPPEDVAALIAAIGDIDKTIQSAAPQWPLSKISKVDLAILRLAVYELSYEHAAPPKVVIDEAVELAKSYGNEKSGQFVNGALGAVMQKKETA